MFQILSYIKTLLSWAHPVEGAAALRPLLSPPTPPKAKLKKKRICAHNDITWFTLQSKSATVIG